MYVFGNMALIAFLRFAPFKEDLGAKTSTALRENWVRAGFEPDVTEETFYYNFKEINMAKSPRK